MPPRDTYGRSDKGPTRSTRTSKQIKVASKAKISAAKSRSKASQRRKDAAKKAAAEAQSLLKKTSASTALANEVGGYTKNIAAGRTKEKSAFQKISDDIQMDLGIKAKDADYYSRLAGRSAASQKALEDMKARRKKKGGSSSTSTDTDTDTSTNTTTTTTTTNTDTDTSTFEGGTVGGTSVTAESIYTRDPEDAISDQEKLAAEELRRQRIKRAREKQSLLRRRIERTAEVGSGRRVLSGTERELNVQSRQAGSGRRGGAGRRSLITGSTGGIGYYSRFL